MKRPNQIGKIVYYSLILILVLVVIFSGLQILESTIFNPVAEDAAPPSKTITRDGVDYFPRQDITSILVLGIDRYGPVEDSGSYQNSGAADMAMVVLLDHTAQECRVLQLNRDTMTGVRITDANGRKYDPMILQLCLAHA